MDKLVNAPTYEEALAALREAYYLLTKTGPRKRQRVEKAMEILRKANDYEVETTMPAGLPGKAGATIRIHNMTRGTCCDPTTETYWSM